jgi:ribosomal protein S27E
VKHVVIIDDLQELEIRPREMLDEYTKLLKQDVARLLRDRGAFVAVACPACGHPGQAAAFVRLEFAYVRCTECRSVYVSPRPTPELLEAFWASSDAIVFWNSRFLKDTARERTAKVFQPRVAWIRSVLDEAGGWHASQPTKVIIDLGAKYGAFLQGIAQLGVFERVYAVAPAPGLHEECVRYGLTVLESFAAAMALPANTTTAVSAFEVVEQVVDPVQVLQVARRLLAPDGFLFLTTLTISGFDLQILGGRSKKLLPPVHLNLLSIEGLEKLLQRCGFEIIELSTPGQLDTEIVAQSVEEDPTIELPPFVSDLICRRDKYVHREFQEFLQHALLSSHVRLVARKPREESEERV